MDEAKVKQVLAGIVLAAFEDAVEGAPNRWGVIRQGLDDFYDGNLLTERVSDYAIGHLRDAYAQGIAAGHARIESVTLKG